MAQKIENKDKLFGGRETAEEVHVKSLARFCGLCKAPASITYNTYAPLETVIGDARFSLALAAQHDGNLPVCDTKFGKYVRVGTAYSCTRCKKDASKIAAKHPDSWFVDIDAGPDPDRIVHAVH